MTPFTQSEFWARLNSFYNGLKPMIVNHKSITCLFGCDEINNSWTSFGGPVLLTEERSKHSLRSYVVDVIAEAQKEKVYQINFRSLFPLRQWNKEFENEFLTLGFQKHEWKTYILNLSASQEQMLMSFKHSARKGIRKAQELGIRIVKCEDFDQYYNHFFVPYCSQTKRPIKNKEFCKEVWSLDENKVYGYWVAKDCFGIPLGFLGTYRYDGLATEIMSAITPKAFEKKIPVQDLLHWEVIKYHKNLGDQYFDLAGFNPNPTTEKEKNIRRFKEKWGGVEYDTSSYTLDRRSCVKKLMNRVLQKING